MFHVVKKCIKPRAADDGNLCRRHDLSLPGPHKQCMSGTADHGVITLPVAYVASSSGTSDGWARITGGSREITGGSRGISRGWARITDGWAMGASGRVSADMAR